MSHVDKKASPFRAYALARRHFNKLPSPLTVRPLAMAFFLPALFAFASVMAGIFLWHPIPSTVRYKGYVYAIHDGPTCHAGLRRSGDAERRYCVTSATIVLLDEGHRHPVVLSNKVWIQSTGLPREKSYGVVAGVRNIHSTGRVFDVLFGPNSPSAAWELKIDVRHYWSPSTFWLDKVRPGSSVSVYRESGSRSLLGSVMSRN